MLPSVQMMLSQSWEVYKKNWKTLTSFLVLSTLVMIALMIIPFVVFFAGMFSGLIVLSILGGLLGLAGILYIFYFSMKISVGFYLCTMHALKNHQVPPLREGLKQSKPVIWKYIGVSLIVTLIIALPFVVGMFGFLTQVTNLFSLESYGEPLVFSFNSEISTLFFLLLTVYGFFHALYFSTVYGPSIYGVIFDRKSIKESLPWGKSLVQGRWWSVFWRLLGPALVYGVVYLLGETVLFLLALFVPEFLYAIFEFIIMVFMVFFVAVPLVYIPEIILYENLKKRS